MHSKIPLLSRGLKLSNSKPGCRVSALHFFVKLIPPMAFWHWAHSDKCFFQLLIPALTTCSLLESESRFEIVTHSHILWTLQNTHLRLFSLCLGLWTQRFEHILFLTFWFLSMLFLVQLYFLNIFNEANWNVFLSFFYLDSFIVQVSTEKRSRGRSPEECSSWATRRRTTCTRRTSSPTSAWRRTRATRRSSWPGPRPAATTTRAKVSHLFLGNISHTRSPPFTFNFVYLQWYCINHRL